MKNTQLLTGLVLIITVIISNKANAQKTQSDIPRYTKVSAGYLMVLRQGDNILKEIEALAEKESIPSASFTGNGICKHNFWIL